MKVETFFENFGQLADAPNGVQKLRELILQLAVQGKLVPQDPNDEPASVLLAKIDAEKERLIQGKKIKKNDQLPPIGADEMPFGLPQSWAWVRLDELCHDWGQKIPDQSFTYIDVSSIDKDRGVISDDVKLLNAANAPSRARKLVEEGTVIYSTVRPYLLNIAIIDKKFSPEPIVSTAFAVLHPFSGLLNKYLCHYLRSKTFVDYVEAEMTGMAYPAINDAKLRKGLVPLPPLAEQHCIVAKVDQLMALCDELEARQQKRQTVRVRLNNATLEGLLAARAPEEFAAYWQRICDNFDLLYDAPETVGRLREAVLQLAVQGRLVPQDPNDVPVEVLSEGAEGEKGKLNGGIKTKSSLLGIVDKQELPFDTPRNWAFGRFGNTAEIISGVTKGKDLTGKVTAFYPYLRVANVQRGFLDLDLIKELEIPTGELEKYRLVKNDIVIIEGGDWDKVGRAAIWEAQIEDCIHQNHIFRARLYDIGLLPKWVILYINSSHGRRYFEAASKQTTNLASINMGQLRNCPIPIPPISEQRRIIAKVDQLMALCDELEAKLRLAQAAGSKLATAAVQHLTAA
ncbi:MAG: restriction endonuclease subunit S [Blastocatellia bacterium]|nr:restriction endonuclease subunit S [Blastocatellia bacterium]